MRATWMPVVLSFLLGVCCREASGPRPDESSGGVAAAKSPARNEASSEKGLLDRIFSKPRPKLTVPAGTALSLDLETLLNSASARPGDTFTARTTESLLVEGKAAVPSGTQLIGHVSHVAAAGKVKGRAEITLELDRLMMPDGEEVSVEADPYRRVARSTVKKDAAIIGGGAGAGALVGAVVGGKKGAGIGAAVGGGAGTGTVLATKGEEVVLPQGTVLRSRLRAALTVTAPEP